MTVARKFLGSCASSTRGVFAGGSNLNVIDFVTIASAGNATDFGDLISAISEIEGCSNTTDSVQPTPTSAAMAFFGLGSATNKATSYVNIATTGNSMQFGDLTVARLFLGACSSSSRGVWAGGGSTINVMDYLTFSSFGNGLDFCDLTQNTRNLAGCSSETK